MAHMYPEWIDEDQRRASPKLRAEFKVYDALAASLGPQWSVFYSRTWTWVERGSRLRTREADFIIAHPHYGILIMEVKGGGIDVRDGKWFSTDRYGAEHEISPFDQVARATLALERRFDDLPRNPFRDFKFSTAVCFPDILSEDAFPHLDIKHLAVVLDAADLADPQGPILRILGGNEEHYCAPGEARIDVLKHLVARSWFINAPKHIQITDTEQEIKKLTAAQFKLLYQIAPSARRLLVSGCAGSGKTMLAAETARRMAQLERRRVLFTCFNRNLALWIRASRFFVDDGHMMVTNFQQLCSEFATRAGIEIPPLRSIHDPEADKFFQETLPDLLFGAATVLGEQFDAIIVDEGQDFQASWWPPLELLLRANGAFHIYYDTRQRMSGRATPFPESVSRDALSIDLVENVRNTKLIHDLAMRFHRTGGKDYTALCQIGVEPEFVQMQGGETEHHAVARVVGNLVERERIPAADVAILTPLSIADGTSSWRPEATLVGRYRLVHRLQTRPHEVFCSSIQAAKGLEFPVVVMTELSALTSGKDPSELAAAMYVGLSRARSHLILMISQDEFSLLVRYACSG